MGELLDHKLPAVLLLALVHAGGLERYETTTPHPRPAGEDVGWEGGAGVVYVLARGVQALAAVAQEAGGVGFGVEVEKECPVRHSKTSVEYVKRVL